MRVLFDACVLYPTVLRRILLDVCTRSGARPLWSARILEEWARAAARLGPGQEASARAEIALVTSTWPDAQVEVAPDAELGVRLPDPADAHVLAAAISGCAETLVTANLRDFPRRALAPFGVAAQHPDAWLLARHAEAPHHVADAAEAARAEVERHSGEAQVLRALLKRAGLPRLGKRLGDAGFHRDGRPL